MDRAIAAVIEDDEIESGAKMCDLFLVYFVRARLSATRSLCTRGQLTGGRCHRRYRADFRKTGPSEEPQTAQRYTEGSGAAAVLTVPSAPGSGSFHVDEGASVFLAIIPTSNIALFDGHPPAKR